ncbi:interferon gamma 1-like [Toxotes jaculatrix]|uniref:interferon gamma 1-like n=1 Tax=Toxotes jaculatrix TaxID=941984 RepID=UPI001B3A9B77|nr:interferon gamma 1-like [Toxotes jaculatrix]
MSSSCGSVCLLVLMGVVLALGSPLHENLMQVLDSIADPLKLKEPEIGSKPLFSSIIKSINTSCQRKEDIQVMNATLDVYMHIFSSLLQHNHHQHHGRTLSSPVLDQLSNSDREKVKLDLRNLQHKMEEMRKHLGQLNQDKADMLSELDKIKVDDPIDQRKALAEFRQVYHAVELLVSIDN